jgi:hypothetical protein
MSTASGFFGSGGGGATIKSIQRGVISIASSASSGTATITTVDTAKTALRFLGGVALDTAGVQQTARVVLTNSTTITATVFYPVYSGTAGYASWELTEFN